MSRLNQALAWMMSLGMLLLLVEGGMRLAGLSPRPTMNQFDATLGWKAKPSTTIRRHTAEFDVTFSTNSRGLRESESVGYAKPPGTTRVLMVGDSFTLGYTVAQADTIPALLAQRLAAEGRAVEVLNGGTEGYSTDQEVLWLAHEGVKYSPDVVLLQMYENDIFWNSQDHYLRYPKPLLVGPRADAGSAPTVAASDAEIDALLAGGGELRDPGLEPWLQRHSALGAVAFGFLRPQLPPMASAPHPIPSEWLVRVAGDQAPGWTETSTALRAFRREVARLGARPLVLVIPDKAQIDPRARDAIAAVIQDPAYDPDRPYRGMLARARAEGLPVVDPEAALRSAEQASGALYFERDWHTNALGNRVLASEVDAALAQPGLLGPPPRGAQPIVLEPPAAESHRMLRWVLVLGALWLILGTLYRAANPAEGTVRSYGSVGALIGVMVLIVLLVGGVLSLVPPWLALWINRAVALGVVGAILWYLRARLPVMAELLASFVRRGQWYALPVLVGLLSIGGLLIVAASSPWLAPFIYTLF
ncbi:MAG TPA: DUF5989 family protein [Candidatus Bathyarchaeia archaeon]|nr:DUF5989 family protein [Candidatus Bathyarchaeia archaeon]